MIRGRKRAAEDDPPLADRSMPSSTVASLPAPQQPLRISKAPTGGPAAALGMSDLLDYSPVPTLLISPSNRIERASIALLEAWDCRRDQLVDRDLFISLYEGSPTERFDRIPLVYAIESAITARALRLCHAAYVAGSISWNARIIPIHRDEELLCLILEWEVTKINVNVADGEVPWSRLPIEDAFRILFQAVKELAIFLLDTRGNVVTWKMGANSHKGYEKEEIVGKHFSIFYSADDVQSHEPEKALEISLRDGRAEDEGWRYGKDGTRFWASVVIIPVYNNGVHVGFGKVTRDLSERKDAELRLIAAYEEAAKLKSDFLANVSHEIRTPMHGMLSACALLLDSGLTEKQLEMANMIEESGCVLLQIINDILDYSKLAGYSLSINTGMIDVASVVASVVGSCRASSHPGVSLKLRLAPNLPKWAVGDALRFRQVAENIVSNATKFTERGLIQVGVSLLAQDAGTYTIMTEVADTGPGLSDDEAQKLFEPFTQLDSTYQKRREGTGLGLSIAKSLSELMGGHIGYNPNLEPHGSIFWFTVKLKGSDNLQEAQSAHDQVSGQTPKTLHVTQDDDNAAGELAHLMEIAPAARILAAEDNVINQKVLIGMLRAFGFLHITVVSDGAQAVSMLSKTPNAFDLVLMDISMPVMNGYEATIQIRNGGMRLPILAMTAYALKGDMERCLENGLDDYIAKPVHRQLLGRKLLKWLIKPCDSGHRQAR
ncbi:hypothetical protein Purlil1_13238 [Purpureocillium lilacinum]|uniref:Sensor histidine kinase/response regulator Fos-1 n=1 Tax=Purpureocillium lilacinum TaxID=33203 RepID=A0ABR0BEZ7_PURLI|nr:hypothetical protein Purlil1_13238 [Purpureocillium lilacinum]